MKTELNEQDKQRIEQEADKHHGKGAWYEFNAFKAGAEYATLYERQATEMYKNLVASNLEEIKELEAERTELRNKVIDEAITIFESGSWSATQIVNRLNQLKNV